MNTKTQEALHKALKVLNCLNNDRVYETAWVKGAINACEEALAQPAQEPVAHFVFSGNVWTQIANEYKHEHFSIPLYTRPAPSWQGLSDDDVNKLWDKVFEKQYDEPEIFSVRHEVYRAIEQALKEKNNVF